MLAGAAPGAVDYRGDALDLVLPGWHPDLYGRGGTRQAVITFDQQVQGDGWRRVRSAWLKRSRRAAPVTTAARRRTPATVLAPGLPGARAPPGGRARRWTTHPGQPAEAVSERRPVRTRSAAPSDLAASGRRRRTGTHRASQRSWTTRLAPAAPVAQPVDDERMPAGKRNRRGTPPLLARITCAGDTRKAAPAVCRSRSASVPGPLRGCSTHGRRRGCSRRTPAFDPPGTGEPAAAGVAAPAAAGLARQRLKARGHGKTVAGRLTLVARPPATQRTRRRDPPSSAGEDFLAEKFAGAGTPRPPWVTLAVVGTPRPAAQTGGASRQPGAPLLGLLRVWVPVVSSASLVLLEMHRGRC